MSTIPPTEFRGYLATANAVEGPDIPRRPSQPHFTESCAQEGLVDAAKGVYDKHSFASDTAMTFERRCSSWLGFALSKAMDQRHDDLYMARDLQARTRAAWVEVRERRAQAEADLHEAEQRIAQLRGTLEDPHRPWHEPLAEALSAPRDEHGRPVIVPPSRVSRWAGGLGHWLRSRPWLRNILWLLLVAGEVGLIYSIAMALGDGDITSVFLAISVSALAVGVAWLAIPPLLDGRRTSNARKVLSLIALVLYVLTMVALGWVRYVDMRIGMMELLAERPGTPEVVLALPWYGGVLFFLLWVALPLALTAVIALLDTRGTPAPGHAVESPAPDRPPFERFGRDVRAARNERRQLVGYLTHLRSHRQELQERIVVLRAEEIHAQAAQEDAGLNETAIDERVRFHLQALPEMVAEGFICYLQGLERGMGDPTMTAHIQEAAQEFLPRYKELAYTKVTEYLVYLDEHPLVPPRGAVGTEGV